MGNIGAERFLPAELNLPALADAARRCQGCDLYRNATQTVFGEGVPDARFMLVGEQPGDQEDRRGAPFVGPAGRMLDRALEEAGIDREAVYLTNAVKHFKFEPRGGRRIHQRPTAAEIGACRPWLEAEMLLVDPDVTIVMGATAARALLGPSFRVTRHRGEPVPRRDGAYYVATIHPSAILRAPDRDTAYAGFLADLRAAAAIT
ncbi:UdgX family uracil-DNA binding protein [Sphaerimonospora mesophila]|uniref:UdgX family uracil-DNA binding protein n=1 Tax=Sphaerimonospora mesophila TaxID=37483 RepID=UPI0006E25B1B